MRTIIRGARVILLSSRTLSRKRHSIYAVIAESKYIKFGYACNPQKRLAALRSGCPLKLRIAATLVAKTERQAIAWEELLHTAAARFHVRGEWFHSNPRTLAFIGWMSQGAERFETLITAAAEEERDAATQAIDGQSINCHFQAVATRVRTFRRKNPFRATPAHPEIPASRFDNTSETA